MKSTHAHLHQRRLDVVSKYPCWATAGACMSTCTFVMDRNRLASTPGPGCCAFTPVCQTIVKKQPSRGPPDQKKRKFSSTNPAFKQLPSVLRPFLLPLLCPSAPPALTLLTCRVVVITTRLTGRLLLFNCKHCVIISFKDSA